MSLGELLSLIILSILGILILVLFFRLIRKKRPQQQQQQQQNVFLHNTEESFGKIILSCNVENVEIYTNGMFVGNAPATLKLKDGIHIIEVKKVDFKDYRKEVRVTGGSEVLLRAELTHK